MESLGVEGLALLFGVALVASFVDAVAGGGGLIALPALFYAGLSPIEALATNKLQGSFGTFASTTNFIRNGHIDVKAMLPAVLLTFIGSALGTLAVQALSPGFLRTVMPFLLIAVAVYYLMQPRIGEEDRHHRMGLLGFSAIFGFSIGFYDGFFGPGAGTFFTLAFVAILGFNLVKATANTKLLNFTSNISSLLFFALSGHVVWIIGLTMAAGQLVGGYLGAHMTMRHGVKLVRPLVIVVSLALTAKLVMDDPDHIIQKWIGAFLG